MKTNLTCIGCPIGCSLTVTQSENEITVEGNNCKKGEEYAKNEVTSPKRTVTSSVRLIGGVENVVSVKTESDIPKDKIFDICNVLKNTTATAPIYIGDIIIENVCDTGVNIVATKNVMSK